MRSVPIVCSFALMLASQAAVADATRELADSDRDALVAEGERRPPEDVASPAPEPRTETPKVRSLPDYQLPKGVGKPRERVGGGRRGPDDSTAALYALVPEHVGFTAAASPTLYWVLEGPPQPDVHFELTLADDRSIEPMVETRIAGPVGPGLQRVRLADYGVTLEVGVEYQWSIALVVDPEQRSSDIVATGWIERVPAPAATPADAVEAAARGLWYDAIDAASVRAERTPGDAAELDALLVQAGLGGVRVRSR